LIPSAFSSPSAQKKDLEPIVFKGNDRFRPLFVACLYPLQMTDHYHIDGLCISCYFNTVSSMQAANHIVQACADCLLVCQWLGVEMPLKAFTALSAHTRIKHILTVAMIEELKTCRTIKVYCH
jgi:hypothetical protein